MSEELFAYHQDREKIKYPQKAILAFTRMEMKIFKKLLGDGEDRPPILGGMTHITAWPEFVLAGPILGAPQAGMALELLGRGGVNTFLSLGWCGAIKEGLTWGHVVLPDSAVSEEGTSGLYDCEPDDLRPDPDLADKLADRLTENNIPFTRGRVWTTDAPFRETRDKVRHHADNHVLAVDMETSAVMAVARFRNLAWAGLMVVSDELWRDKWNPGFHSKELKIGLQKAAGAILSVLEPGCLDEERTS